GTCRGKGRSTGMKPLIGRTAVAALVALAAFSAPTLAADKYGVKDDAKFFTPEAVEKANQKLEELSKKYGANFRIETVVLTPEQKAAVAKLSKDDAQKHFKNWAKKRFDECGIGDRGGFILVVKTVGQVHSHFGSEADAKYFGANGKKFADQLVGDLTKAKNKQ